MICQCLADQLFAEANNIDLLTTDTGLKITLTAGRQT